MDNLQSEPVVMSPIPNQISPQEYVPTPQVIPTIPADPTAPINPAVTSNSKPKFVLIILMALALILISGGGIVFAAYVLPSMNKPIPLSVTVNDPFEGAYSEDMPLSAIDSDPLNSVSQNQQKVTIYKSDGTMTTFDSHFAMSFTLPEGYAVIKSNPTFIQVGFTPNSEVLIEDDLWPYLDITNVSEYAFDMLPTCENSDEGVMPCTVKADDYSDVHSGLSHQLVVGGKSATGWYVIKDNHRSLHVVQVKKSESENIFFEMNISGGGLDDTFQKLLTSVTFP